MPLVLVTLCFVDVTLFRMTSGLSACMTGRAELTANEIAFRRDTFSYAASVETVSWGKLLAPSTWKATVATWKNGHKVHKAGKRVNKDRRDVRDHAGRQGRVRTHG